MKIEILFPEHCNLFGDMSNMTYLKKCLPEAEFIETALSDEPYFAKNTPSLIYMGPMTERTQEKVIQKLLPLKERIAELMESGTVFLFTGNAMEVLFTEIKYDKNEQVPPLDLFPIPLPKLKKAPKKQYTHIKALGLLPVTATRDMMHRHNSTFLGSFAGKPVMGFKSQFSSAVPTGEVQGLFAIEKGVGLSADCPFEGVRRNNFFGTYLLGPILILNPDFTRQILTLMGVQNPQLAFAETAEAAYESRLKDFRERT